MLFASFAFALMGTCVKLASEQYSIAQIVTVRGLVGVALLYLVARASNRSLATPEPLSHLWRGLLGVVSLWLWFVAITRLPLATAVTLNYMSPIWTALALVGAAFWKGERRVAWPLVGAILVSFAGVVLVLRPAFANDQWLGGPMALAPAAHAPGWHGPALLLGVGIAGTAGQLALTRAYRLGRTLVVANLQYSGIVFSSLLGAWIWGDVFHPTVWAGIAVILASCIAAGMLGRRVAAQAAPSST